MNENSKIPRRTIGSLLSPDGTVEFKDEEQKQTEKEQQQKNDTKNKTKTETYTGTVEGEGTSKRSFSDKKTNFRTYDEPIDAEWREVNSEPINSGRSYVNQLLLEDKRYK